MPENDSYICRSPYRELSVDGINILDFGFQPAEDAFLSSAEFLIRNAVSKLTGAVPAEKAERMIELSVDPALERWHYSVRADKNGVVIRGADYESAKYGAYRFVKALEERGALPAMEENAKAALFVPDRSIPAESGTYTSVGDPVYLIEDSDYLHSGWDTVMAEEHYRFDGMTAASHAMSLSLPAGKNGKKVSMSRRFLPQTSGTLVFDASLTLKKPDGLTIAFSDGAAAKTAFTVEVTDGGITTAGCAPVSCTSALLLRVIIDSDASSYTVFLGSSSIGTYPFAAQVGCLDTLTFFLSPDADNRLKPNFVYLSNHLPVAERFLTMTKHQAPVGFVTAGDATVTENDEVLLKGISSMRKEFSAFDGKAVFEWKFNTQNLGSGAAFSLQSGDRSAFTLRLSDITMHAGEQPVRFFDRNFWYQVRVEADTRTRHAELFVNGKSLGYFPFENSVSSFDRITVSAEEGDTLYVDDLFVYQKNDHADYCPAPLSHGSDGYCIAMQSCSLWRNGVQWGWDCVTPFDEIRPYLGYYDEGNPELADWEIKYMAEHGVDYQIYCWFNTAVGSPVKKPYAGQALHDGYFNARYSGAMKFAIMWENANGSHPGNSENFRKYIVPYWVEYYLTDPRYMVIDNKPVISVFSLWNLYQDFGSAEAVRAELDYLRKVCIGLGYDGAYILVTSADANAEIGIDATYKYSWSKTHQSDAIIGSIRNQYRTSGNTVPTASVGFNNVAWAQTRSALAEPGDYRKLLTWIRDEFGKNYAEDCWLGRSAVLATWNEYGEGHYIMPTPLYGFGYLDAVRAVFAPDNACENIVPTEAQKARIGTLFPKDRQVLRARYQTELHQHDTPVTLKAWDFSKDTDGWDGGFGLSSFTAAEGTLHGTSVENDFCVFSGEHLNLDITSAVSIEVTMRCSQSGLMEIFYITEKAPDWKQEQSFSASVTASDDFITYVLPVSGQHKDPGKLLRLRIDPLSSGCEFEIASVKINGVKELYAVRDGNREILSFKDHKPYFSGKTAMIPMDPVTGIVTYLGYGYKWDGKTDTITIFDEEHTYSFTVGSDTALADGAETALSHPVEDFDGLPAIPADDLNRLLGTSVRLINLLEMK